MGRVLQLTGALLMLVAIGLGLGLSPRADAEILAPLAKVIAAVKSGALHVAAVIVPPKAPAKKYTVQHGGRLQFDLGGSLSFGRTSTTSSFGAGGIFTPSPSPTGSATPGPFPFQGPNTNTTGETDVGLGFSAHLSRRTSSTLTDVRIPIGLNATGRSSIGLAQVLYSTPKFSVGYGAQPLNALGQLQLGSTLRGLSFILPERYGQATYFEGPSTGVDGEATRMYGVLSEQARGNTLYEAGFIYGVGPLTGVARTLLVGMATGRGTVGIIGEGAWQSRSGGDGSPHGPAAQLRLDDTLKASTCSTSLRYFPSQFVTFGSGEIYGDKYAGLNCTGSKIPVYLTASWETTGDAFSGSNHQSTIGIGYSPQTHFGGLSFNVLHSGGGSAGQSESSNGFSFSAQTQVFKVTALLGAQLQRSISDGVGSGTQSLLASLHRAIGHYNVGLSGQVQRQSQDAVAPDALSTANPLGSSAVSGLQKGIAFNVSRSWRKTTIQLGETITYTTSDSSDAIQKTPLINLTRQLSPAIAVTTSLGFQSLADRLNPAANGRTRVFSISLSAPFSYGNSNVTGRADPRLPATIVGRVVVGANGSNAGASYAALVGTGGVGNVTVRLDDKYVQQTDLTGGFQFAFVPAGQHQITIDTASIPRGFTASMPVQSVVVQGGQEAAVSFTVSTFGGILGYVYGSTTDGVAKPLANVKLRVDGGVYAQTDNTGAYGFGGLSPGEHEVTVIPETVPADSDFTPHDLEQKISVNNGQYARLDFRAQSLGSISGQILYSKDMKGEYVGPVANAYVVAEPGEHAAIDDNDGTFIIDNLPAGDYTISVDRETIDEQLGASPDTVNVHLGPGERYQGILFAVGRFEKKVVFSLLTGSATPAPALPVVRLSEDRLPPRGVTEVTITAPSTATDVVAAAFGKRVALAFSKERARWVGELSVPATASPGRYVVLGSASGVAAQPTSASLTVDPKLPLSILQFVPQTAPVGATVTVRARFLVSVHAGDRITWQDGTTTVLGKPVSGRVFTFRKVLTLLPLHGLLLTPQGSLPIELL